MPFFKYKIITTNGETEEKRVRAESQDSLQADLVAKGQQVVFIEEVSQKLFLVRFFQYADTFLGKVKEKEKIILARNLGSMINAGLPLSRALSVLERQSRNKKLKSILVSVQEDVGKGNSFNEALGKHPKIFSKLFVSMVAAGEGSGNLSNSLKNISDQMDKTYAIKKKVKGAMLYPAIILCIMFVIGILMLMYVVPTLTSTFKELEIDLPFSTRLVIGFSDFVRNQSILAFGILIALVIAVAYFFKTKAGRRTMDFMLLHMPVVSGITKGINSARTARTLSALLSAGVEYVEAISITGNVLQNSYYKNILKEAGEKVEKGEPISKVLLEYEKFFPVFVGEMASVGEETGNISNMFSEVADFYEEEVQQKTKDMSTLIEPFLMVIIGIAVGFFAISMLTPTYSLVDAI